MGRNTTRRRAAEAVEGAAEDAGDLIEAAGGDGGDGNDGDDVLAAGGGGGGYGPDLVSMAQAFSGLPMDSLIGGPLNAAAEANQQMGLAQINFLMQTCFTKTSSGKGGAETYTPVMVTTSVTRNVIDTTTNTTKNITATIELPLFSLLPINTLGVTSVGVDFTMNVSSSYSNDKKSSTSVTAKANASYSETVDLFFTKTTIKGNVSVDTQYKNSNDSHYQKKNSATYKVTVAAGQLPLPPGVTTLITAFADNITPIQVTSK